MKNLQPEGEREVRRLAFPRQYRLTKTDEFSSVFSFRKTLRGGNFLLHYRPRGKEQLQGTRLGLVVAKRFLRRSVDRNLLRRLVREAFRQQRSGLPPYDLIVRLSAKPVLPLDRRAVSAEILSLLDRLRTLGR